jgi:hypothetical protein
LLTGGDIGNGDAVEATLLRVGDVIDVLVGNLGFLLVGAVAFVLVDFLDVA